MKILIIADYAPPYNKIGAVRIGKTAKYLKYFGHDVRLLTSHHSKEKDLSLPLEIEQHELVYADCLRFSDTIQSDYWDLSRWHRLLIRFNTIFKSKNLLFAFREDSIAWLPTAQKIGQKKINSWRPDIIFSSALPIVSHIVAHRLAKANKIPWVAEYRDLWSGGHGAHVGLFSKIFYPLFEKFFLNNVSALITVSQPLADHLKHQHNKTVTTVFNGFDDSAMDLKDSSDDISPKLRMVYTGAVYEGRDPSPLFCAIQLLDTEVRNHLSINFYSEEVSLLQRLIKSYEVSDVVSIQDRVPYEKSLSVQASADVLLFLSYSSKVRKNGGILSGKAFEYLSAKRPILSVGADDDHVLCNDGLMINMAEPTQIASQLKIWIVQKQQLGGIPSIASTTQIEKWSRKSQTLILERVLLDACDASNLAC